MAEQEGVASVANKIPSPDHDTEWGRAVERPQHFAANGDEDVCHTEESIEHVDVAIVGGGLAGLAVAIGLTRRGTTGVVKVYERAPKLRSHSQGILGLQPNGLEALERIHPDIPSLALETGCERLLNVFTTIHANGTVTEETRDTGSESKTKYGRPKIGLTWHKMQRVLSGLLPSDLVVTGRSLQRFHEDDDHVRLYFADGSVVQANAVVACDGVFSVARRQLFPHDSPIFFGQLNWATIIETSKLPAGVHPPNAVHYFQHDGEPRWMSMLNDGGAGQTFWQFRVADPEKALSLSGNKGRGGLGLAGVKEALLPLARPSRVVAAAIDRMPEPQIFERAICGRYPALTWLSPRGRLVLVGDSATGMHPNIGQGANTAFESAASVVDAIVAEANDSSGAVVDWKAALESFEKKSKTRADLVQRFSNMMGVFQATGNLSVSKEQMLSFIHWIVSSDPNLEPPAQVVRVLETFEPCDATGVSLLW